MKILCGSLALVLSLVVINLAPAEQGREQPKKEKVYELAKVTRVELTIDSSLVQTDAKDTEKGGSYAKVFLVKLVKGKTYQIDMRSKEFDSFLRLEDAGKKQLAEDDDSGGGVDAQIVFTPTADGVYRIIATSFDDDETGAFNLLIQEK